MDTTGSSQVHTEPECTRERVQRKIRAFQNAPEGKAELAALRNMAPHVDHKKYTSSADPQQEKNRRAPAYISVIEEEILYPADKSHQNALHIQEAVRKCVAKEDLPRIHAFLSRTLSASWEHGYACDYDRWICLLAVLVFQVDKSEENGLAYFTAASQRISTASARSVNRPESFRERAVILSDYITTGSIDHSSEESRYFRQFLESPPPEVEEEDNEAVSDESGDEQITTLRECVFFLNSADFSANSDRRKMHVLASLRSLVPFEPPAVVEKHGMHIIQTLLHLRNTESESIAEICAESIREVLDVRPARDSVIRKLGGGSKYPRFIREGLAEYLYPRPKLTQNCSIRGPDWNATG